MGNPIKVYSMNGSLLFEESYKANQVNIETSSLTTGAYMLVLETKRETIRRKLIIK
ncbi:T9SS type A sorting domain-containing protein [Lentimicrobium sp. L6]|uniref:T9SS type A sorting domain-containing protein n=1 Tax=Lentimicrobium sp. L6 TaxID=2735916 RepID=UPI0015580C47|nr:T9SS type A sorting domain-containing protein [Lentimicrobium sp. L6]NPD86871.1 T9SS type A sorting domain-containing protein [Lentimicrobium sp. L6]